MIRWINDTFNAAWSRSHSRRIPEAVLSPEEIALTIRALARSSAAMPESHETLLARETRAARETRLADKLRRAIS